MAYLAYLARREGGDWQGTMDVSWGLRMPCSRGYLLLTPVLVEGALHTPTNGGNNTLCLHTILHAQVKSDKDVATSSHNIVYQMHNQMHYHMHKERDKDKDKSRSRRKDDRAARAAIRNQGTSMALSSGST